MDRANFNFQYKKHKGVSHMSQLLYEKKHRLIATMVQAQSYQKPIRLTSTALIFVTAVLLLHSVLAPL